MPLPTLLRQDSPLAQPLQQLRMLADGNHPPFEQTLAQSGLSPLRATGDRGLQVNVGKLCNQTCRHCHVDAGPERREVMSRETMALASTCWPAPASRRWTSPAARPEMNPHFRWLVSEAAPSAGTSSTAAT